VQQRVRNAPLCCKELRAVPVVEIEYAERLLMEGLNYEFQCHHASDIIDEIFFNHITKNYSQNINESNNRVDLSPRSAVTSHVQNKCSHYTANCDANERMRHKALDIAQRANIFSDAPFLYSPCDVAFAIAAIASSSILTDSYCIGSKLLRLYFEMNPKTSQDEFTVSSTIGNIILSLVNCQKMDLFPNDNPSNYILAERATELRRIMSEVATLRLLRKMSHNIFQMNRCTKISDSILRKRSRHHASHMENKCSGHQHSSKRSRIGTSFTPPHLIRTCAKITPTVTGYHLRYIQNGNYRYT
jgi:hypothetical protein